MLMAESADTSAPLPCAQADACELYADPQTQRRLALLAHPPQAHRAHRANPAWTCTPVQPLFQGGRCGAAAGPWLFRVGLWVPAAQRAEFLAWYEQEHLPILLECATWDGCRFVEAACAEGCRFHALHQLADEAALRSAERARSRATPWFLRLKQYAWFDAPFTRSLWQRMR